MKTATSCFNSLSCMLLSFSTLRNMKELELGVTVVRSVLNVMQPVACCLGEPIALPQKDVLLGAQLG